ncbi:hypothetical protein [Halorubrum saccharovorum]|nr:hypothetical protein [Halorubrum saccharovorum]
MKTAGLRTSFDAMMNSLANVQRRRMLVALLEHNPQDDVLAVLVDSESESDAVERLVSMHHIHLPKLANHGFIDWDKDSHKVTKGPKFDEIRPLLELLDDHEDDSADWL